MENFTKEQEKIILDLYCNQKRGQAYCAKAVGSTNVRAVRRTLIENGVKIRNFSEAASETNKNRAKNKNHEYFKTQSHNMAWLLGFLASDGTVSSSNNRIKLGLASKDREILEKIRQEVSIENEITDYVTNSDFDVSELCWSSETHKKDLAIYGITPNKTFTLKPPLNLQKEYYIDYIRGYFDGDGSINLIHSNGKVAALRWQICAASKEMIDWIISILDTMYDIPRVSTLINTSRKRNLYYCQYSTNATKKIFNVLYTPNSLRLQRKYDHFIEVLSMK